MIQLTKEQKNELYNNSSVIISTANIGAFPKEKEGYIIQSYHWEDGEGEEKWIKEEITIADNLEDLLEIISPIYPEEKYKVKIKSSREV